jgi:hypothetical protein
MIEDCPNSPGTVRNGINALQMGTTMIPPPPVTTSTVAYPVTTTTGIPPCTGDVGASIQDTTDSSSGTGSYQVTFSGQVTNGRSDPVNNVWIWFSYNAGSEGSGTANPEPPNMGQDSTSEWTSTVSTSAPVTFAAISSITYDDTAEGPDCYPYPLGGKSVP